MKHKLLSAISISFILLLLFNVKTVAIENKDNSPEMTDERAIEIIKEIADFMDSGEKIGDEISCRESDGYNDYYFKNKEDEEKLYKYHRDYIKDAAYDYLCEMYDIRFYRGRCTQSRTSRSDLSSSLYYKINTKGEFSIKSKDKKVHVFKYNLSKKWFWLRICRKSVTVRCIWNCVRTINGEYLKFLNGLMIWHTMIWEMK